MASEPEGRELHEAVARAMGWTTNKWDAWYRDDGSYACAVGESPEPTEREMLAWLHERGIVHSASSSKACQVRFMSLPGMDFVPGDDETPSHVNGRDLREALGRLVLAVAQREAKA